MGMVSGREWSFYIFSILVRAVSLRAIFDYYITNVNDITDVDDITDDAILSVTISFSL